MSSTSPSNGTIRDFRLPDLGEGLEEGEIVEWHVAVGDVIELNATVASIETAKAVVDVPSPFGGTVVELVGDLGETLEVGEVFVRIDISAGVGGEAGAVADDAPEPADDVDAPPESDDDGLDETDMVPRSTGLDADTEPQPLVGYGNREGGGGRRRRGSTSAEPAADEPAAAVASGTAIVLAKPPVRKLAKDLGVDLAAVAPGSGTDGIITRDDVRAAAAGSMVAEQAPVQSSVADAGPEPAPAKSAAPSAAPAPTMFGTAGEKPVAGFRGRVPGEVEEVRGVRKRIIAKMSQSRREIPHATCRTDADVTELWDLRRTLTAAARAEGHDVKVTPTALVMRATVLALRRFPTLNATFDGPGIDGAGEHGTIRLHEPIHLGVAVDTDNGLMVPVVKDAHAKSTLQLAAEAAALAAKCRDGSVTPGELTGGTFTVDNYGSFGNDDGNPIINHPEVGILGVGAMRERPWVVDGEVVARRVCSFTLAFDHRVADGGEAGRFTTYVADLCAAPSTLLLHL